MRTGRRQERLAPRDARCGVVPGAPRSSRRTRNTRTDRGMFFRRWAPRSSKARVIRVSTSSRTSAVTQIPPGSASSCTRAATFSPSPYTRAPSYMTSPKLTPMRKCIWRDGGTVDIALGHRTLDGDGAFDRLHDAPELRENAVTGGVLDAPAVRFDHGQDDGLMSLEGRDGGGLVLGHQAAIPGDICRQDGGESAFDVCLVHTVPRPATASCHHQEIHAPARAPRQPAQIGILKHVFLDVHPWLCNLSPRALRAGEGVAAVVVVPPAPLADHTACNVAHGACIFHRPSVAWLSHSPQSLPLLSGIHSRAGPRHGPRGRVWVLCLA